MSKRERERRMYDLHNDKTDNVTVQNYIDRLSFNKPPQRPDGKPRIAMLMLNSPNIKTYAHCATMNNYLYATKHGYDFIVERLPINMEDDWTWDANNEYVLVWYKAELLKRHLKNYDYVFYIDSDATVINFEYTIEDEIIKRFNDDFSIVFQEDVWSVQWAINNNYKFLDKICAGILLAKNSQITFDILDTWIRAPYTDPDCIKFRYIHAREQDCIMTLREKYPFIKENVKVFPAYIGLLGQYDAKWIIHLAGKSAEHRHYVLGNILQMNIGVLNTKNQ